MPDAATGRFVGIESGNSTVEQPWTYGRNIVNQMQTSRRSLHMLLKVLETTFADQKQVPTTVASSIKPQYLAQQSALQAPLLLRSSLNTLQHDVGLERDTATTPNDLGDSTVFSSIHLALYSPKKKEMQIRSRHVTQNANVPSSRTAYAIVPRSDRGHRP